MASQGKTTSELMQYVMKDRVRFGFMSNDESPETGKHADGHHGLTFGPTPKGEIWSFISIDDFEPLLRVDLSDAERLAAQFAVAVILFHEIMVSNGI